MKRIILVAILCLPAICVMAQDVKLLNATEQHWVGGQCCSYGTNYIVYLETTDTLHFINIDTVWIGDKMFAPAHKNSLTNFRNVRHGKTTYRITAASQWKSTGDEAQTPEPQTLSLQPPKYKGKACLVYYSGRQRMLIAVPGFKKLPTITYP